jgi:hypothetical protein
MMVVEGKFLKHSLSFKSSRATRCTNAEDLLSNYVCRVQIGSLQLNKDECFEKMAR